MAKSRRKSKPSSRSTGRTRASGTSRSKSSKVKDPGSEETAEDLEDEDMLLEAGPDKRHRGKRSRSKEIAGVLLLAAAVLAGTALLSLQFGEGTLMGPFGRAIALGLYAVLGTAGYLVVPALALIALRYLAMMRKRSDWLMWFGYAGATVSSAVIIHCLYPEPRLHGFSAGGKAGEVLGGMLLALFSSAGTYLVASIVLLISLMLATDISFVEAVTALVRLVKNLTRGIGNAARSTARFLQRTFSWKAETSLAAEGAGGTAIAVASGQSAEDEYEQESKETSISRTPARDADAETSPTESENPDPAVLDDDNLAPPSSNGARQRGQVQRVPKIIERKKEVPKKSEDKKKLQIKPVDSSDYELPIMELLVEPKSETCETDKDTMLNLARRLEVTLEDYGISGRVREIHPGPVVTMYEFAPERGTKLSKITALSSDLAMSMEATKVRIVAPIPGKNAVGIEIPNQTRETVYLRELLEDEAFYKGTPKLRMALGKDINGNSSYCDMAKAPHLLIAGATGAGKSVGVHAMVLSLLYQYTPEDLRLLLIDPKMLEFSCYHDIPHLLHPVVTDPQQANLALRWAVEEMESRYQKLAELGVRDLDSYNRKVERILAEQKNQNDGEPDSEQTEREEEDPETCLAGDREKASGEPMSEPTEHSEQDLENDVEIIEDDIADMGELLNPLPALQDESEKRPPEKLPYVVVIIDEFADLMMASPKEVETSVARIAQKARAAGIHLVVATQRPSTDVITGLIRANFPTRVAYQVSSRIDSRVVLEQHGAEALLGMGDMLFTNRGLAPKRAHGPLVTTEEIDRVADHIREQARPNYNMDIVKPSPESEVDEDDEAVDPKYDEAVAVVASQRIASISFLQRKLRVGYNRAARMIEMMEKEGVVGPSDGVKGREVLVTSLEDREY